MHLGRLRENRSGSPREQEGSEDGKRSRLTPQSPDGMCIWMQIAPKARLIGRSSGQSHSNLSVLNTSAATLKVSDVYYRFRQVNKTCTPDYLYASIGLNRDATQ